MRLEYRAAELSDADCIFRMAKQIIDDYEDAKAIDYAKVLAWVRRKIEKCIGEYVCVFCDGEKAGYYRLHPENGKLELDDLYILPPFQNRGVGTAVLEKCLAEADCPIFLYVFTRNERAVALYCRKGFQVTERVGKTRCIMEHPCP